jgi:hypothetical protein
MNPGPMLGPAQLTVQVAVNQATLAGNLPLPTGPAVQTRTVNAAVTVSNAGTSVDAHLEDLRIFGSLFAGQDAYPFTSSAPPPAQSSTVAAGQSVTINRSIDVVIGAPFQLSGAFDVSAEVRFNDELGNTSTTPAVSTSVNPPLTLPPATACAPAPGIDCIDIGGSGRFRVNVSWAETAGQALQPATVQQQFDDGAFWFFGPDNTQLLVQLLDNCTVNDHFWVFLSATSNLEVNIVVEDTQNSVVKEYRNALGTSFQAVQDTAAFATCPGPLPAP